MGLLSPWCPPFTNVQVTASRIYEHHDSGEQRGAEHDATSGICPLNLCIYMVPVGVKSYKRPQSFNRPPDCRERREKGLGAESIRYESVKA